MHIFNISDFIYLGGNTDTIEKTSNGYRIIAQSYKSAHYTDGIAVITFEFTYNSHLAIAVNNAMAKSMDVYREIKLDVYEHNMIGVISDKDITRIQSSFSIDTKTGIGCKWSAFSPVIQGGQPQI